MGDTRVRPSISFSLSLSFLLGALGYHFFVPICRSLKAYVFENYTHNWVFSLSPDIRHIALYVQFLFEEFLAALPVCAFTGVVLGLLIKRTPLLHGLAASVGAMCIYAFYRFYLSSDIFPAGRVPAWFYAGEVVIWVALFMCIIPFAWSVKRRVVVRWERD